MAFTHFCQLLFDFLSHIFIAGCRSRFRRRFRRRFRSRFRRRFRRRRRRCLFFSSGNVWFTFTFWPTSFTRKRK